MANLNPLIGKVVRVYAPTIPGGSYIVFGVVSAIDAEYIVIVPLPKGANGGEMMVNGVSQGIDGRTLIPFKLNLIITELTDTNLQEVNIPKKGKANEYKVKKTRS